MKKILIVDDEQDILKVVKFRLIKAGYDVITASNGQEGLDTARAIKPDLLLLDLSMPLLNGDEVCKRLKADPATKHIPIILMTASSKGVKDENIFMAGMDDRILKPFEPEDLFEKIKKLIG